jgi:hypothetical protein
MAVEMEVRDQMQKIALESRVYGCRRIAHELHSRLSSASSAAHVCD